MNALLAQRKYRLAGRLATDTAMTFGLWSVVAFLLLAAASFGLRAATGGEEEYAFWVLAAIPVLTAVLAWVHLSKSYPLSLANGLTRKEFLVGYVLFGVATVLVTAVLTQLGNWIINEAPTAAAHHSGFYGLAWSESLARPALYFAVGAAAGAAKLRFANRWGGAIISALLVSAVLYRTLGVQFVVIVADRAAGDGWALSTSVTTLLVPLDAALTIGFALIAWILLAKAPMRPKPA